jgi:hypothetical protein
MRIDDTTKIDRAVMNESLDMSVPRFRSKEAADADAKDLRIGIMNLRHVVLYIIAASGACFFSFAGLAADFILNILPWSYANLLV